ncbi:MAG TPA: 30S ribosomal protein S17 [Candidatus Paceibacterota bacterium]|jgi:small subunit ribosomal protein S17|nr:30S ribosomal protein S17 [Candidatus Paceibacterota bacterium]HRR45557.1 30S ribosomal protein S17 [Candidatus Paceibacterota bacterium]
MENLNNQQNKKKIQKRTLKGVIVSDKMNKTAVVEVEELKLHPKYRKYYRVSKKFKAHNPDNRFKEGEKVLIEETRPLSKEKRWSIIKKVFR